MSAYPSLPLFTDAFIADTGHLSAQETGAYLMLMMVAWRSPECRLPDDDDRLARWARVDRRTWIRIKQTVLEFWTLADGFWIQKRLNKEREIVSKRADAARENGRHGGRPKSLQNNDQDNPTGLVRVSGSKAPNPNPNTSLRSVESESSRRHVWPDDFRETVWNAYGKPVEKKAGLLALDALHRGDRVDFTEFITGIRRQAADVPDPQFRPSLERYIKREKWTDQVIPKAAQNGSGSHDLFRGGSSGNRPSGTVNAAVSAAVARHADRRGLRSGGGPDGGRPREPEDRRPRRDDSAIEDADWTPTGRYHAAH